MRSRCAGWCGDDVTKKGGNTSVLSVNIYLYVEYEYLKTFLRYVAKIHNSDCITFHPNCLSCLLILIVYMYVRM